MTSASGYITAFNKDTNFGYIQIEDDESNKQFLFHLHSLKKNSRRYVTKDDLPFDGELFDFDIIKRVNGTEDEAVNIRHRVLKCPIVGCSRLTAFTKKKALNDHIETKHLRNKKVTKMPLQEMVDDQNDTSMTTSKPQEQSKKSTKKSAKLQPFMINLSSQSPSTLGRFFGKNGVNIKLFQQKNNVRLKLLTKSPSIGSLKTLNIQFQVKPYRNNVNVDLVRTNLKLAWDKAVREQKVQDERFEQLKLQRQMCRSRRQSLPFENIDIVGDTRHTMTFSVSDDEQTSRQRTNYRKTETMLRTRKERSRWTVEGHRCFATSDLQKKGEKMMIDRHKKKTNMKDQQWLVREQLYDV